MSEKTKRRHIIGLDTLKLIAIILIVIYHCFPGALTGGFIAVEIFFAISGFLIGQKLLSEYKIKKDKFGSPKEFFKFTIGRLKRFLPTLLFCIILTLSLAYFADPDLLTGARPNTLSAVTFSTNIVSIITGSTYENSLILNLFNPTWFLALELQVCLLFYLIFAAFTKLSPMKNSKTNNFYIKFLVLCLLIATISFGLMALYGGRFSLFDRAYFGPDSHIGAFFLGAALAVFTTMHQIKPATEKRRISWLVALLISIAGVIAMAPFIHYDSALAFIMALPLTAALSIIMIFAILKLQKPIINKTPRALIIPEYLGKLSFAIYLLHWGLYILLPSLLSFWPLEVAPYIAIALSIGLAILLQKVITPFSKKHKIIFAILLACSTILPIMSLIKAPEKSSIEENLAEAKIELDEANNQTEEATTVIIDYSGMKVLANLLNGEVMKFFDGAEDFAKPYPVATTAAWYGGGVTGSLYGRDYYSTPDYGRTSELASKRVMVLGDSVVLGATADLYNTVPGVFVDAMGSRNMTDAINLLAGYRAANGGSLPYIIVIGLVTNYVNFGTDTLQAIMDAAGPGHQFVFMTGYCGDYSRDAQNNTIRWMANNYGNVHVGDWVSVVVPNVDWYTYADHTHLTPAGRQAYADLVYQVVSGL
ncbi:acyltransferase [Candidatus Saccharibacteria bacterium]|nr:acyltransferase [Candidatus Saccharibacteria bacterium]